ncbi:hypothetical protein [Mesorhizobium sp. 43Arga]
MLSALIWVEPRSSASSELILEHVQSSSEPDRAVRFWALAGTIAAELPYVNTAINLAKDDPAREVSGLAAIVADPGNDLTLQAFRSALNSHSFELAWHVLRILRVVSLPSLAEDVVAQLERSAEGMTLTYDALFALATPSWRWRRGRSSSISSGSPG